MRPAQLPPLTRFLSSGLPGTSGQPAQQREVEQAWNRLRAADGWVDLPKGQAAREVLKRALSRAEQVCAPESGKRKAEQEPGDAPPLKAARHEGFAGDLHTEQAVPQLAPQLTSQVVPKSEDTLQICDAVATLVAHREIDYGSVRNLAERAPFFTACLAKCMLERGTGVPNDALVDDVLAPDQARELVKALDWFLDQAREQQGVTLQMLATRVLQYPGDYDADALHAVTTLIASSALLLQDMPPLVRARVQDDAQLRTRLLSACLQPFGIEMKPAVSGESALAQIDALQAMLRLDTAGTRKLESLAFKAIGMLEPRLLEAVRCLLVEEMVDRNAKNEGGDSLLGWALSCCEMAAPMLCDASCLELQGNPDVRQGEWRYHRFLAALVELGVPLVHDDAAAFQRLMQSLPASKASLDALKAVLIQALDPEFLANLQPARFDFNARANVRQAWAQSCAARPHFVLLLREVMLRHALTVVAAQAGAAAPHDAIDGIDWSRPLTNHECNLLVEMWKHEHGRKALLDLAETSPDTTVAKALFVVATGRGEGLLVASATQLKIDVVRSSDQASLLHLEGNPDRVRLLLAAGLRARLEARTTDGRTPLLAAIADGRHEAVRVLLEAGARTDVRCNAGSVWEQVCDARMAQVLFDHKVLLPSRDGIPMLPAGLGAGDALAILDRLDREPRLLDLNAPSDVKRSLLADMRTRMAGSVNRLLNP